MLRRKPAQDLLQRVPLHDREWRSDDDGLVCVLEPRYGRTRIGRWLARSLGRPFIEIKLDELGSAAWHECDGQANVASIARTLRQQFGERVEPVDERIGRFFEHLARTRLIRWERDQGQK